MAASPAVIQWVQKAARATGADPAALLATALQESGARLGAVGDQGTSYGPFQFHVGGALGQHSPAWANTYAAALNRAQEFARLGVHGGEGAAAVQRPADEAAYAQHVQALLPRARALLSGAGASLPPPPVAGASSGTRINASQPGGVGVSGRDARLGVVQELLDANARLAGIPSITLPTSLPTPSATPAAAPRLVAPMIDTPLHGGYPLAQHGKLIGFPYQGTHTLYGNWESDNAVDISAKPGTPVYAAESGTIGSQIGALNAHDPRLQGLRVHIDAPNQAFYYAHLSRIVVKPGERVGRGQLIGYSGSANGVAHLHLAVQHGDPRTYLK